MQTSRHARPHACAAALLPCCCFHWNFDGSWLPLPLVPLLCSDEDIAKFANQCDVLPRNIPGYAVKKIPSNYWFHCSAANPQNSGTGQASHAAAWPVANLLGRPSCNGLTAQISHPLFTDAVDNMKDCSGKSKSKCRGGWEMCLDSTKTGTPNRDPSRYLDTYVAKCNFPAVFRKNIEWGADLVSC